MLSRSPNDLGFYVFKGFQKFPRRLGEKKRIGKKALSGIYSKGLGKQVIMHAQFGDYLDETVLDTAGIRNDLG
jgi:hypothetical protein